MSLQDKIKALAVRYARQLKAFDWRGYAKAIIQVVGKVMHNLLFNWLMPKRYRNLTKQEIFEIIFKSDTPAGKKFDIWLLVLIGLNIVLLMLDSMLGSSDTMSSRHFSSWSFWLMKALEWGFTLLFTFEYYLRIYCLKHPWRYVFSLWGIIDFISIFPAYLSLLFPATQALTVLRLLRVMRIFRIFKLYRFQGEMIRLINIMHRSVVKILVFMLFVFVVAIILGTVVYALEAEKNPDMTSIPVGIYWAVVTITTVGYGDIVPVTVGGRFIAVVVMLLGYSIIAVSSGIVAGETIAEHNHPSPKSRKKRRGLDDEYAPMLPPSKNPIDDETDALK